MAAPVIDSEIYAQSVTATSLTFAFNNVAGDYIDVMGHDRSGGASQVTGVTYNAVSLSKITELNGAAGQNDRAISAWGLVAPATGSNNVVVSSSVSNNLRFSAISYSGVHQTTPRNGTPDSSTGSSVTSISTDVTTDVDECIMVMLSKDGNGAVTYSNSTGDSIELNTDAAGHCITVSGSISPAGSNTITNTMSSQTLGAIAWAIRPASGAVIVNPVAQVGTLSIPAYTPKAAAINAPSTQGLTFSVPTYTTKQGVRVDQGTNSVVFTIPTYVVSEGGTNIAVGTQTLTFTIPTYTAKTYQIVMPDGQVLTFSTPTYSIEAIAHIIITPNTVALTFTVAGVQRVGALWRKSSRNSSGIWTKISRNSD